MTVEKLNSSDYRFLRELLDTEVGILLEDGKEYLAVTRLETVMWEYELPNLAVLISRLRKNDKKLKASVIDAMTVNETLFFRDPNVWNSLRDTLLPQIIEAKHDTRILRCWSAASSSGQEPYSLAIVISELLGKEDASWDVKILASDLSTEMVTRTKEGIYSNYEVGRGMAEETRDRYFRARGDKWQVNDRLRARVETRQLNLSAIPRDLGEFDIIMLRNVLIYFSADTRNSVLRRMATMLTPTGCLLLGASEGAVGVPTELIAERMSGLVAFHSREASEPATLMGRLAVKKAAANEEQSEAEEPEEAEEDRSSTRGRSSTHRSFLRGRSSSSRSSSSRSSSSRSTSSRRSADAVKAPKRAEARSATSRRSTDSPRATPTARSGQSTSDAAVARRAARSDSSGKRSSRTSDDPSQRTGREARAKRLTATDRKTDRGATSNAKSSTAGTSRAAARSQERAAGKATATRTRTTGLAKDRAASEAPKARSERRPTGSDRATSPRRRSSDPAAAGSKAPGELSAIERLQALREKREHGG